MMTLQEIVTQLHACGYTCEAGKLENNVAWQELERLAKERTWVPLTGDSLDYATLDPHVGIWAYHEDGREISISTSEQEIFARLPHDIRLCRKVQP